MRSGGKPELLSSPQSPSLQSVVSKAKLAARSLFNILHAQTCSNNKTCAVRGCHEMKLVLLHVKQCSAGPNFPCPHPGCNQARKLLSHYKRCRELRLRQTPDRPHQCLVCSLLAREVKTYERERHNKPRPTTSSNQNNSRPPTYGAVNVTVNVKDKNGRDVHNNSPIQSQYPSFTPRDMPPPPPRPPNIPISMHRNIQTVAALTNPHTDSTSKGLGKSLDSSSGGAWMSGDTGRGSKRDRSVSAGSLDDCKSPAHGRKRNEEPIEAENLPQHNTSKTVNNNNNSNMPMQPQVLVRRRSSSCGVITGIGGFETIREEDDEEEDELGNFQFEY
ncbi:hypothetical protein TL16_g05493 [Triparma laevis f. inornata]|uniref:TAZ-type domain-containing protein n=1 Tax=Triparma laevis f. inornata TaxID=1714386 RepID=A0A9W7AF61_9STRA|nr:hypothetical protein TL16_g05493 [Triparma laevis f. inornata]